MTKKAFIAGTPYAAPYTLPETVNDIANWQTTLASRGFTSIITKKTAIETTRANLRTSLAAFVASLVSGDSAAIILLGHGGQITDTSGDEPDGIDECYVSSDLLPISDDEIGDLLKKAALGTKIDIVMDYCYAGAPDQPLMPGFARDYPKSITPAGLYRSWGACREGEVSYSARSGTKWYSLFSLYLCWALRAYPAKSAIDLMTLVSGYVTTAMPKQHPVMAGQYIDQVPF
jgi:hypothetical protein